MNTDRLLTGLLTAAAIVIAGTLVHREFFAARRPRQALPEPTIVQVPEWRSLLGAGTALGKADAPIQIIEFSDLECPFCRRFHDVVRDMEAKYPARINSTFIHYPLKMHRFARIAAHGAECAGRQGRFAPFLEAVFAQQDSLGLKEWVDYARVAKVPDVSAFDRCRRETQLDSMIIRGLRVGDSLGVISTPTVIINGWRYGLPPNKENVERAVQALLDGKTPEGVALRATR